MRPVPLFDALGRIEKKRFFFGSVPGAKFDLPQLAEFENPFTCGILVARSAEHPTQRLSAFSGVLIGLGCSGIAFFGGTKDELEDAFDKKVLSVVKLDSMDDGNVIWSTTHPSLSDMIFFLAVMSVHETRGHAVYLMQLDGDSLREECARLFE